MNTGDSGLFKFTNQAYQVYKSSAKFKESRQKLICDILCTYSKMFMIFSYFLNLYVFLKYHCVHFQKSDFSNRFFLVDPVINLVLDRRERI